MKNFFKARIAPLFGIIAFVAVIGFSMVGCGEKGGIVEVTNTGSQTYNDVKIIEGTFSAKAVTEEKRVAPGETVSFTIEDNGNYKVTFGGAFGYDFSISGGETVKITIPIWRK